ncbi:MAG: hypothetical protein FWC40_07350 [Proteobacteria bacterium]|nr:hypothetical protein [Pseudomonadota bacterium]
MFGRKKTPEDAVDVNDLIVGDSMQRGIYIDDNLGSPVPSIDIPEEQIIDADAVTNNGKKFKITQVLIVAVVLVVTAGGIVSIFLPDQATKPPPFADQLAQQPVPANLALSFGLSEPLPIFEEAPPADIPAANASPEPEAVPEDLVSPVVQKSGNTSVSSRQSIETPPVVVTSTPADPSPAKAADYTNPVAAQIAEAQKLSPSAPSEKRSLTEAAASEAKPIAPVKKPVTPASTITQNKAVLQAAQPREEASEEGIKRLITVSAEAFGLQSIHDGSITLEGRHGAGVQRLQSGDRLPSGEQLLRIDARSMTLITDRSVIRIK